jgi:ABC-type nickel/cobalt efflux system permease component RcnA
MPAFSSYVTNAERPRGTGRGEGGGWVRLHGSSSLSSSSSLFRSTCVCVCLCVSAFLCVRICVRTCLCVEVWGEAPVHNSQYHRATRIHLSTQTHTREKKRTCVSALKDIMKEKEKRTSKVFKYIYIYWLGLICCSSSPPCG